MTSSKNSQPKDENITVRLIGPEGDTIFEAISTDVNEAIQECLQVRSEMWLPRWSIEICEGDNE